MDGFHRAPGILIDETIEIQLADQCIIKVNGNMSMEFLLQLRDKEETNMLLNQEI